MDQWIKKNGSRHLMTILLYKIAQIYMLTLMEVIVQWQGGDIVKLSVQTLKYFNISLIEKVQLTSWRVFPKDNLLWALPTIYHFVK